MRSSEADVRGDIEFRVLSYAGMTRDEAGEALGDAIEFAVRLMGFRELSVAVEKYWDQERLTKVAALRLKRLLLMDEKRGNYAGP